MPEKFFCFSIYESWLQWLQWVLKDYYSLTPTVLDDIFVTNLGYNIYGDEWNGTYNQDDHMLSPAEPTQTRFYIQDKLEFKDVVVQVGLSME